MDSLAGYVATICVTVIATYLSQFLKPKVKIVYRLSHTFLYSIPTNQLNAQNQPQQALPGGTAIAPQQQAAPNFMLLTHSLTIQNVGRKTAEWVQIVHRRRPDFFQLHPALNYTEGTTPAGEHMLTVQLVAPNDYFTVELLSYLNSPEVLYIRSSAGYATTIAWMPVRQYPWWVYQIMRAFMGIGVAFCAYWLIKAGLLMLRGLHVIG